jgi:hypothetical protein
LQTQFPQHRVSPNSARPLLSRASWHGINPFDYLKDLFTRLPAAKITQIKEFTPAEWAKAKENEVDQAA